MTRDRTGREIEPEPEPQPNWRPWHNPECRNGWLGEDNDGHPIPCLHCRPHLRQGTKDIRILKPEWEQRQ